eukprot:1527178-Pleurochrysis_carterae.AAC.4
MSDALGGGARRSPRGVRPPVKATAFEAHMEMVSTEARGGVGPSRKQLKCDVSFAFCARGSDTSTFERDWGFRLQPEEGTDKRPGAAQASLDASSCDSNGSNQASAGHARRFRKMQRKLRRGDIAIRSQACVHAPAPERCAPAEKHAHTTGAHTGSPPFRVRP